MNLERFIEGREPLWRELDAHLARARGRPERLGPDGVRRLGALYQAAAADLALARRRFPSEPVVGRLESLVTRARSAVYGAGARRGSLLQFAAHGYWRQVREQPAALLAGALFLFVPAALGCVWALDDPAAAFGVVPEEFRAAAEPGSGREELGASEGVAFSTQLFTNNIQVSFAAFAAGIVFCLGTVAVLAYNGLLLGALAGLAGGGGHTAEFVELVAAHGVLELSLVVVTAGAGLRIGWALVSPGPRRRQQALAAEARRAIEVVLGSIPWFVVAGVVAAVNTARLGLGGGVAFGIALGALYWGLVLLAGRSHSPATA